MNNDELKMRKLMREAGLKPPLFESGYFFTVTFKRPTRPKSMVVPVIDPIEPAIRETVNEAVKNRLIKILSIVYRDGSITRRMAETILETTRATMQRSFSILKVSNLVVFSGAPKTGT
jgi:predicted HTH transcriptional regulator